MEKTQNIENTRIKENKPIKSLKKYNSITPYIFLLPALIILTIFVFYPLIRAFIYSFQNYNIFTPAKWVGLENYRRLLNDDIFRLSFRNSLIYFIGVVPPLVILPLLLAILVNTKLKGITFFRASYYLPVVTSMVVAGIAWKWIYADSGLLNYFLQDVLHIINEPIQWLSSSKTSLFSVMIVTIWKGLGYYMVIYLAGLQSIPNEIWEAAKIDGAVGFKKLVKITIPMMKPSMALVSIMSSMAALKVFDEIYIMTGGGPYNSSKTIVYYIYDMAFSKLQIGYASAVAFILFFMLLAFAIVNIRYSERDKDD